MIKRLLGYGRRLRDIATHPSNRGNFARSVSNAARFRWAVASGHSVDLPVHGGHLLRCYPDSDVARSVAYFGGNPDFDEMAFLDAYLRPGDVFVDVGANVGLYSLAAAARVSPGGQVHAVEPVAATSARLSENIRLNGLDAAITVHRCAIGEAPGTVRMTSGHDATNFVSAEGTGDEVAMKTLDELFGALSLAMAKLDVEGLEWPALRGARRMLEARNPPVLLFEVNGSLLRYGEQPRDFLTWVEAQGYVVGAYDSKRRRFTRTLDAWDNVFAFARDRIPFVKDRIPGLTLELGAAAHGA